MSWLFVATLCLTNQWLVAQATYEGVKTPPQEISIDGVLETKAYVRGVSPNGRYIWAAYYHNQAAYVYDTELKKCIWQKSDAGREIEISSMSPMRVTSSIRRIVGLHTTFHTLGERIS